MTFLIRNQEDQRLEGVGFAEYLGGPSSTEEGTVTGMDLRCFAAAKRGLL
jgi:hypothetical protein